MKTTIIGAATVLLLLQNCVAPPDGTNVTNDRKTDPQPVTAETVLGPTAAPAQVSGLQAVFVGSKAKLTWTRVEGAFGYEIYREKDALAGAAPGEPHPVQETETNRPPRLARIPGIRLDVVAESNFNDYDLDYGYTYTYRVVAINRLGKGPASKPAKVQAVLFPGWARAAAGDPYNGNPYPEFDWADAIGTQGGNAGLPTTTAYPVAATQYTSCTGYGVALGEIRPQLNALIPDGPQTFALDLNHNLPAGNFTYEFYATAFSTNTYDTATPLYKETGTLSGCGEKQLAFTADFTGRDLQIMYQTITVYDPYGWEYFERYQTYRFENGVWLLIEETVPAAGATLPGGTLSVHIRHNRLPSMNVTLRIDNGYSSGPVFATALTAVSGAGDFTLAIPYEMECGYTTARLRLSEDSAELDGIATSLLYLMPTDITLPRMRADLTERWLSSESVLYGFETDLNISSCVATPVPVTVSASPGWLIYRYASETGEQFSAVVTGMTNDYYMLTFNPAAGLAYGTVTGTALATFPSDVTRSAVVRGHIHDYFWQIVPPALPVAGVDYALAVTVAGPRPVNRLSLDVSMYSTGWNQQKTLAWSEAAGAFTGAVNFTACGGFYLWAGSYSPGYAGTETLFGSVEAGSVLSLETPSFWFNSSDFNGKEYDLVDACGAAFTWAVVYAPAWMRFQSLGGASSTPLVAGIVESEAFPDDQYGAWGNMGIQLNGTGPVYDIDISAYR